MQELQALEPFQIPFYAMNLSVALSVSVAGFGLQVASGLLGELPFGSISMVGAKRWVGACLQLAPRAAAVRRQPPMCFAGDALLQGSGWSPPVSQPCLPGACSVEEARRAREAGADCVLVKAELVHQFVPDRLGWLVEQLREATSGDD